MTERFSDLKNHLGEIQKDIRAVDEKVAIQNGRVRKLEDFGVESTKLLESCAISSDSYKVDKARLWTAFFLITFLGSSIIALSILAIDGKIEHGIKEALADGKP